MTLDEGQPEYASDIPVSLSAATVARLWIEGGHDTRRMIDERHAALESAWREREQDGGFRWWHKHSAVLDPRLCQSPEIPFDDYDE